MAEFKQLALAPEDHTYMKLANEWMSQQFMWNTSMTAGVTAVAEFMANQDGYTLYLIRPGCGYEDYKRVNWPSDSPSVERREGERRMWRGAAERRGEALLRIGNLNERTGTDRRAPEDNEYDALLDSIRKDYAKLVESDWFKRAYVGKSLGEIIGTEDCEKVSLRPEGDGERSAEERFATSPAGSPEVASEDLSDELMSEAEDKIEKYKDDPSWGRVEVLLDEDWTPTSGRPERSFVRVQLWGVPMRYALWSDTHSLTAQECERMGEWYRTALRRGRVAQSEPSERYTADEIVNALYKAEKTYSSSLAGSLSDILLARLRTGADHE